MKLWQMILCVPGLISLGSVLWSTYLLFLQFRSQKSGSIHEPSTSALTLWSGVSILKPLKGVDADLDSNLESFFKLEGNYELIFSVADHGDPAIPIVEKLIAQHPSVPAQLLIGERNVGLNPKINNLLRGIAVARFDWLLISDSNVRADQNLVAHLADSTRGNLNSKIGMSTAIIAGVAPTNWGARLEAMMLNSYYARGMVLAFATKHPCVVGKAMLFKRSVAKRFGGMETLSQFLAEDYQAGQAVLQLGYQVKLMRQPVTQILGSISLQAFWRRHVRWGLLRKTQAPLLFYTEWLLASVSSGTLLAAALPGPQISMSAIFAIFLLVWMICDALAAQFLGAAWKWYSPLDWICRELIHLPIWCAVVFKHTVLWRGERLRVGDGGLLQGQNKTA